MNEFKDLPRAEFAFPGPLRELLVSAVVDGSKTTTAALAAEYRVDDEPLPKVNARHLVIDSAENAVAVIEITDVQVVRLAAVPWEHARDEGEGYTSLAEWRAEHQSFWDCAEMRSYLGDASFVVDDDTEIVLERFRVLKLL